VTCVRVVTYLPELCRIRVVIIDLPSGNSVTVRVPFGTGVLDVVVVVVTDPASAGASPNAEARNRTVNDFIEAAQYRSIANRGYTPIIKIGFCKHRKRRAIDNAPAGFAGRQRVEKTDIWPGSETTR